MTKDQHIENLKAEIKQLNEWIDDLQREIHKLKLRNAFLEELLDGDQLY